MARNAKNTGDSRAKRPARPGTRRVPGRAGGQTSPLRGVGGALDDLDEDDTADGELRPEGWEPLADEDPQTEPENLIEELLATGDDGEDGEDGEPAAAAGRRVVRADGDDDGDDDEDGDDPRFAAVLGRQADEFTCASCWLIRKLSQRAAGHDDLCRDCV